MAIEQSAWPGSKIRRLLSVGSRSEATVLSRQTGRAASPRRPFPAGNSEICPYQVDAPDGRISRSLGETASVPFD
jgi:hypothetical protein